LTDAAIDARTGFRARRAVATQQRMALDRIASAEVCATAR